MKRVVATTVFLLLAGLFLSRAEVQAQTLDEQIARQFVQENASLMGLTQADVTDIVVTDAYRTEHNGITHVYLQQRYQGIGVYNALINISVKDGQVFSYGNRFISNLASKVVGASGLSAQSAVTAAAASVNLNADQSLDILDPATGAEQKTLLNDGGIALSPIPAQLVYQPTDEGQVRLAWNVGIEAKNSDNWWQIRVDAATGAVLDRTDWTVHDTWVKSDQQESFRLRTIPDLLPVVLRREEFQSSSYAPDAYNVFPIPAESPNHPAGTGTSQTLITNPADPTFSPLGWHDTDGVAGAEFTITRGNNVHAYEDRDGNDIPPAPSNEPDGGATLDFNFPIDLINDEPEDYTDGATVNLFYYNNIIHDVLANYGFDEASGNFQQFNYTANGAGGDYVQAQAQSRADLAPRCDQILCTRCNANFGTPRDGFLPRMRMYVCENTSPTRDGDLDNGVIAHEYGHGVSNRLTGGPDAAGCLQNSEQMGEGWSDFFAVMLSQTASDDALTGRGMGTYLFGQPPNGPGIRARPYSTDFSVNDFTYDNIKTASGSHATGHVWNTMLWDLNWALIGDLFPELGGGRNGNGGGSGFNPDLYTPGYDPAAGGNNLAIQLVMDGMKLQACSPGFIDGRNGILLADEAMTPGADGDWMTPDGRNAAIIWNVFARRGLGFSASQGSSNSRSDGVEAFDIPELAAPVAVTGEVALENDTPVPDVLVDFSDAAVSDDFTDDEGLFDFAALSGDAYTITPQNDGSIPGANSQGVDVGDILAIRQHILNNTLLPSPYAIIAADATHDDNVNVGDILATRQLILNETIPNGGLWRFINSDFSFNDPADPFADVPFDTTRTYDPLSGPEENQDFVAIKKGDVNASWTAPAPPGVAAKRAPQAVASSGVVRLSVSEQSVSQAAGEEVLVAVRASSFEDVAAYQMTLSWDASVLDYAGFVEGGLPGLSASSFGVSRVEEGLMTTLWDDARGAGQTLTSGSSLFVLRFRVVGVGDRSVSVGSSLIPARAYRGADLALLSVEADGMSVPTEVTTPAADLPANFALHGNYPNPFNPSTTIRFDLPEMADVRVEVIDMLGRRVMTLAQQQMSAGVNRSLELDASRLASGTYLYRITAQAASDTFVKTGRMTLVK